MKYVENQMNELVKEFIESPYSLMRFCFNKNLVMTIFKRETLPYVKKYSPKLFQEFEQNMVEKEEIKRNQIQNDIYPILRKIQEDPNLFGLIDVCLLSNYDILELLGECDNVLKEKEDKYLFRKTIRNLKNINYFSEREIQNLLNSTFIFNVNGELTNITKEDTQTVLGFLIDNNIPLSAETFKNGCLKLYQKRLFQEKTK